MRLASKRVSRRLAAVGSAFAVAVAGCVVGTGVSLASAEDKAPEYGNIDADAKGSITVYKHEYQSGTEATSGTVADSADALDGKSNPVANVFFKAFKINELTLTGDNAAASWNTLSTLSTPATVCDGVEKDSGTPTWSGYTFAAGKLFSETNAQGKGQVSGLDLGAYVVCEVEAPSNVVKKADPFLVTIPYPDTTTGKWVYNVTAYPKNSVGSIEKTIVGQPTGSFGLGSDVSYPISAKVPSLAEGEHFQAFIIDDDLDPRLGYSEVTDVKVGTTALTQDTDYKITVTGQKVSVSFTKAGITQLEANIGQSVRLTLKAKVTSLTLNGTVNGTISNSARLYVDPKSSDIPEEPTTEIPPNPTNPPQTSDNPPTTKWGKVKITKKDAADSTTPLKGAQFQVLEAEEPYPTNGNCASTPKSGGSPISVNGATTFTTNNYGTISIEGLFVTDTATGDSNTFRCYVLVETAAPDGYTLPTIGGQYTPITVKVAEAGTEYAEYDVLNTKHSVPNLPLTGAQGRILLGLLGVALIAVAGGVYIVKRRKDATQA